ncbi:MAG: Crp/Fnr family transcriptional regulator [Chloroflexi bacterium]|nr:Crp/Fnr family transcriptional regulator [Chloroflexota bacterium]MYK60456.1 Crp/Fnr family transcriptional regulator [Chloroflexota bacterium]
MAIEITGFAQALTRCQAFESVDPEQLENVLYAGVDPLEMLFVEPSVDVALIQSGETFSHLYFVQHGMVVPWQYPHSELVSPFLIGDHEFMMGAERWVASYSAVTETTVVAIPVATMRIAVDSIPQVRAKMHLVLLRRLARYYWISLSTTGSPAPRVAAALISRLALSGMDHGRERKIALRQREIGRLTVMSRSAVANGISTLAHEELIRIGDEDSERFSGLINVPDVDRLKEFVFGEVREKQVRPLLPPDESHDRLLRWRLT